MNDEEIKNIILSKKLMIEMAEDEMEFYKKKVLELQRDLWEFRDMNDFSTEVLQWDINNEMKNYTEHLLEEKMECVKYNTKKN